MAHIGHVHDSKQVASPLVPKKRLGNDSLRSSSSDSSTQLSSRKEVMVTTPNAPLWALHPRQMFETKWMKFLCNRFDSIIEWYQVWGLGFIPTTGDLVDPVQWCHSCQGRPCKNHAVWSAAEAEQVVNVESSARSDRARGTVLGRKPAPPSFQEEFEKLSHRLEWKQVMPMLAV